MRQILYISTARAPLTNAEITALLGKARRNNLARGITGLLVVGGRRFLQALEGPEDTVLETFGRICANPTHHAIVKLADKEIDTRCFDGWSMGYEPGGIPGPDAVSLEQQVEAIVAPIEDANLRAYFTGFARRHGRM